MDNLEKNAGLRRSTDGEDNGQSRYELKAARQENQSYKKIEQEILNSGVYGLNDKARSLIADLATASGREESETILAILEKFNQEQGALPDGLGEEYVRILFSPDGIKRKMDTAGKNFHEAVAALAVNAKEKNVILDEELINQAVKKAEKILSLIAVEVPEENE
ncbi:MAG: hypothetical protein WC545_02600 [Patescibacteria group bacterium]